MYNVEELKQRLAKEGAVKELDTRDAYAVEWTVAAMSKSNEGKEIAWAAWKQVYIQNCTFEGDEFHGYDWGRIYEGEFTEWWDKTKGIANHDTLTNTPNSGGLKLAATQPDKSNEAIEFAEWISDNYSFCQNGEWLSLKGGSCHDTTLSTAKLYKLFEGGKLSDNDKQKSHE